MLATVGLSFLLYTQPNDGQVVVSQDGEVVATRDLGQDGTVELAGNTVEIVDSAVTMTHADCPNQVCVHQGTITHGGQVIVCAPNRVTVTIVTGDDLDGVAY